NYRRLVTGRMNLSVNLVTDRVFAVVAGRGDDDYAGIDQSARGATNRIVLVRIESGRPQAHVDDANVVLIFVERIARAGRLRGIGRTENPVKGIQQYRSRAGAVLIKDAQINNAGVICDALIRISAGRANSRRGRCHVRAVSKRIISRIVLSREIFTELYARPGEQTAAAKSRVSVVDSRVEHCDANSGSIVRGGA